MSAVYSSMISSSTLFVNSWFYTLLLFCEADASANIMSKQHFPAAPLTSPPFFSAISPLEI